MDDSFYFPAVTISSQEVTVIEPNTINFTVSNFPKNIFSARVTKNNFVLFPSATPNPRVSAPTPAGSPTYFGRSFYFQLDNTTMNDTGVFRMELTDNFNEVFNYPFQLTVQGNIPKYMSIFFL